MAKEGPYERLVILSKDNAKCRALLRAEAEMARNAVNPDVTSMHGQKNGKRASSGDVKSKFGRKARARVIPTSSGNGQLAASRELPLTKQEVKLRRIKEMDEDRLRSLLRQMTEYVRSFQNTLSTQSTDRQRSLAKTLRDMENLSVYQSMEAQAKRRLAAQEKMACDQSSTEIAEDAVTVKEKKKENRVSVKSKQPFHSSKKKKSKNAHDTPATTKPIASDRGLMIEVSAKHVEINDTEISPDEPPNAKGDELADPLRECDADSGISSARQEDDGKCKVPDAIFTSTPVTMGQNFNQLTTARVETTPNVSVWKKSVTRHVRRQQQDPVKVFLDYQEKVDHRFNERQDRIRHDEWQRQERMRSEMMAHEMRMFALMSQITNVQNHSQLVSPRHDLEQKQNHTSEILPALQLAQPERGPNGSAPQQTPQVSVRHPPGALQGSMIPKTAGKTQTMTPVEVHSGILTKITAIESARSVRPSASLMPPRPQSAPSVSKLACSDGLKPRQLDMDMISQSPSLLRTTAEVSTPARTDVSQLSPVSQAEPQDAGTASPELQSAVSYLEQSPEYCNLQPESQLVGWQSAAAGLTTPELQPLSEIQPTTSELQTITSQPITSQLQTITSQPVTSQLQPNTSQSQSQPTSESQDSTLKLQLTSSQLEPPIGLQPLEKSNSEEAIPQPDKPPEQSSTNHLPSHDLQNVHGEEQLETRTSPTPKSEVIEEQIEASAAEPMPPRKRNINRMFSAVQRTFYNVVARLHA